MEIRRVLFPTLCLLFAALLWKFQAQASQVGRLMANADPWFLFPALGLQLVSLFNQPALFAAVYRLVGIKTGWRELFVPVLAGRFINVVAPAAGLGETALLFELGRRRRWDTSQIAAGSTLYFLLNFLVFGMILLGGFGMMAFQHHLGKVEIITALPILLGLPVAIGILCRLAASPTSIQQRLSKVRSKIPPRFQWFEVTIEKIGQSSVTFATALRTANSWSVTWIPPLFHAVMVDALEIAVLGATMKAFEVSVNPSLLLGAYIVSTLFTVVSLTPQGIGAVEGALGALLLSSGVPLAQASAVVAVYRGLSFGMPLLAGLVAARYWSKSLAMGPNSSDKLSVPALPR